MDFLSEVQLQFEEKSLNAKLLFGTPVRSEDVYFSAEASKRKVYFKPDSLFALELWAANDYGTVLWMIYILRSVWPGERANRVPQVTPGAEILLSARGKGRVLRTLAWLEKLQTDVEDPASLAPEYFQTAHYSLKNGLVPRAPHEPYGPVLAYLRNKAP